MPTLEVPIETKTYYIVGTNTGKHYTKEDATLLALVERNFNFFYREANGLSICPCFAVPSCPSVVDRL